MRSDNPAKIKDDDSIGRYTFSEKLVTDLLRTFKNGQDSLVIGINGKWGAGKSTVLNFIEAEIKAQTKGEVTKTIVFRFNPWMFSGQADLQKSFLSQLGLTLKTKAPSLTKLREDIIRIVSLLSFANAFNPDPITGAVAKKSMGSIEKVMNSFSKEDSIETVYKRIQTALKDSKLKLFIIIDDIDRLSPSEIIEVMKMVRLNGDLENTIYFLAYDVSILEYAFSNQWGEKGKDYIKKIVQLDYSLPQISDTQLFNIYKKELQNLYDILSINDLDVSALFLWNDGGLSNYLVNIRDIKRYFNAIELRLPGIKEDINPFDYMLLEAVRLFDFDAYQAVYQHREILSIGDSFERLVESSDEKLKRKSNYELITKDFCAEKSITTLQFLFNEYRMILSSTLHQTFEMVRLRKEKRIVHTNFFERYFTFILPEGSIPQTEIQSFLAIFGSIEKAQMIQKYYDNGKFQLFLNRVFESLDSKIVTQDFIRLFFNFFDENYFWIRADSKNPNREYFAENFLTSIKDKYSEEVFLKEVLNSPKSYFKFFYLIKLYNQLERQGDNFNVHDLDIKYFVSLKFLEHYEDKIIIKYHDTLTYFTKLFLSNPSVHLASNVSYILSMNQENKEYDELLSNLLRQPEGAIKLFESSLQRMMPSDAYQLSSNNLMKGLTIDLLDEHLSKIPLSTYLGPNKKHLALFYKLKEKNFDPNIHVDLQLKEHFFDKSRFQ